MKKIFNNVFLPIILPIAFFSLFCVAFDYLGEHAVISFVLINGFVFFYGLYKARNPVVAGILIGWFLSLYINLVLRKMEEREQQQGKISIGEYR